LDLILFATSISKLCNHPMDATSADGKVFLLLGRFTARWLNVRGAEVLRVIAFYFNAFSRATLIRKERESWKQVHAWATPIDG
jgi:hypothetical protein